MVKPKSNKKILKSKSKNGLQAPAIRKIFKSHDFSLVEDSPRAMEILGILANQAVESAIKEVDVMGLPKIIIRENKLIRVEANGVEKVLEDAMPPPSGYFIKAKTKVFNAS